MRLESLTLRTPQYMDKYPEDYELKKKKIRHAQTFDTALFLVPPARD